MQRVQKQFSGLLIIACCLCVCTTAAAQSNSGSGLGSSSGSNRTSSSSSSSGTTSGSGSSSLLSGSGGSSTTGGSNSGFAGSSTAAGTGNGGTQTESFIGGNQVDGFIGGGRQSAMNGGNNRQFRSITDQTAGQNRNAQQSTGTPRQIRTALRVGFGFPALQANDGSMAAENTASMAPFLELRPELRSVIVNVDSAGMATLTGTAATADDRRLAGNLIRFQPGIRRIDNQIRIAQP